MCNAESFGGIKPGSREYRAVKNAQGALVRQNYLGSTSPQLHSKEIYWWKENGDLLGKIIRYPNGNDYSGRYFTYDDRGNVLTSTLDGNLTGCGGHQKDEKSFTYSNNGLNLVTSETDSNGKTIRYTYIEGTNHISAKFTIYDGQIQLREFYEHSPEYIVVKKIEDDGKTENRDDLTGATERHLTYITPITTRPYGYPQSIEKRALDLEMQFERTLGRTDYHYTLQGWQTWEDTYDAHLKHARQSHKVYDNHGNVVQDVLSTGESISRQYDANDNLIMERSSHSSFTIHNAYDFSNRLISQEELHDDGRRFVNTYRYDYMGNCIASTDCYGNETKKTYDAFGRVITSEHPPVRNEHDQLVTPVIKTEYDIAGHPIHVDSNGHHIYTDYTVRGNPTKVTYPDGTLQRWSYTPSGLLASKTEKNGMVTRYSYDPMGRILEEVIYDSNGEFLKKTQNEYNALHLLRTIGPEGEETTYSYDFAGRLEYVRSGSRVLRNGYDAMGRKYQVQEWYGEQPHEYRMTVYEFDALDQIISERIENSEGHTLYQSHHAYDHKGNVIFTKIGDQITTKEYDCHNQITKITNALGHSTHTTYDHDYSFQGLRVLRSITTDPLGYQTIHLFDTAKRLVEIERKNPFGDRIAHQKKAYDLLGNTTRIWDELHEGKNVKKVIETQYTYTSANQIDTLVEAVGTPEQKITKMHYNQYGEKSELVKPDGTILHYEYDGAGRLHKLQTNDHSQIYTYNRSDQVLSVTEPEGTTTREYDQDGQMIRETLANGLTLRYAYDKLGRGIRVDFPDQTVVEYIYDAVNLKKVNRIGHKEYSYQETEHTALGQIAKIELPGNQNICCGYNAIGNCTDINSTHFSQHVPENGFDASGNLLEYETNGEPYKFTYDEYYQLQSENGHTYRNDSLCNRVEKDEVEYVHNSLNQIVSIGNKELIYDRNGNLIRRCDSEGVTTYTYDSLDRLIEINKNGEITTYTYDAFHRRLSKKSFEQEQEQFFFYQGQEEIGIWAEGKCQELRILTNDKRHSTAALELQGNSYFPVFDIAGNVVTLLDENGCLETYSYTAFGQTDDETRVGNYWQFAGKRLDPESGLIAFGVRYYDPGIGRWLTPDPGGFIDGPNLYAYVHNNPLLLYDEFGFATDFLAPVRAVGGAIYDGISYGVYGANKCYNSLTNAREPTVTQVNVEDDIIAERTKRGLSSERTKIYDVNSMGLTNPATGQPFALKESRNVKPCYFPGMGNNMEDFRKAMTYLAGMSEYNVYGVFCPSYGIPKDVELSARALYGYQAFESTPLTLNMWHDFVANSDPRATFFNIPHSRGAIYVRNTLMCFPKELAHRIENLCVAPGGYIPKSLCKSVTHLVSPNDLVPLADFLGIVRCSDTIKRLTPHKSVRCYHSDHFFMSPTYRKELQLGLKDYANRNKVYD